MEEKLRILKMLEEGKLTAEQAARLLEALKESSRDANTIHLRGPRFKELFSTELERIPEIVANAIEAAIGTGFSRKSQLISGNFSAKERVLIKGISSNIKIQGWDKDYIFIDSKGLGRIREMATELNVKTLSGDLSVNLPKKTEIEVRSVSGDIEAIELKRRAFIKTVSGDIRIENIEEETCAVSFSGNISGKNVAGSVRISSKSGDIDLVLNRISQGELKSFSGDIRIVIPKESNLVLELETETGKIGHSISQPFETIKISEGYLKLGLGNKSERLFCQTRNGDITIKEE